MAEDGNRGGVRSPTRKMRHIHQDFTVTPQRLRTAQRANHRLLATNGALALVAFVPWLFNPAPEHLTGLHWASIWMLCVNLLAAVAILYQHYTAKWWLDEQSTLLTVSSDEVVIRGSIRIPMNVIHSVWGYRSPRKQALMRRNPVRRWMSDNGAATSAVTILVSNLAPVIDRHHCVRKLGKQAEVPGRVEVPVGSLLDESGDLDKILEVFSKALPEGKPVERLTTSFQYDAAWSGQPSKIYSSQGRVQSEKADTFSQKR